MRLAFALALLRRYRLSFGSLPTKQVIIHLNQVMAKLSELNVIWQNLREIDLQNIRNQALREVQLVLVGASGVGCQRLAEQLRQDPSRPDMQTQSPILILDLGEARQPFSADLVLLLVEGGKVISPLEVELISAWKNQAKKVLIFFNQTELATKPAEKSAFSGSQGVSGSVEDVNLLQREFIPKVLELLPDLWLGLGRQFPLFRVPIARRLIKDTCFANATYALGTGLAEVVAVLNLPLTLTDMVVLTKSQAFLAYRLGLVFGFSLEWRDYLAEFGSVIGGGFVWRQLARSLVGLIPMLGIVPKIAVAYSGTYVVGHAILQWYLTGRHLSSKQMRALSMQAFRRGQDTARHLLAKLDRKDKSDKTGKLKKKVRKSAQTEQDLLSQEAGDELATILPISEPSTKKSGGLRRKISKTSVQPETQLFRPVRKKSPRKQGKRHRNIKLCVQCGQRNAEEANYCQYCGLPFSLQAEDQNLDHV